MGQFFLMIVFPIQQTPVFFQSNLQTVTVSDVSLLGFVQHQGDWTQTEMT